MSDIEQESGRRQVDVERRGECSPKPVALRNPTTIVGSVWRDRHLVYHIGCLLDGFSLIAAPTLASSLADCAEVLQSTKVRELCEKHGEFKEYEANIEYVALPPAAPPVLLIPGRNP